MSNAGPVNSAMGLDWATTGPVSFAQHSIETNENLNGPVPQVVWSLNFSNFFVYGYISI